MMKLLKCVIAVVAAIGVSSISANASVFLNFEGLKDIESINGFYNGGAGSLGSVGPVLGVTFTSNALALIDADAGGSGNFGGEPSPNTAMFFLDGSPLMNVTAGFGTSFSTYYTAPTSSGLVEIYDGLNGSGIKLATLDLPTIPSIPHPIDPGFFQPFEFVGIAFSGTARSVVFTGVANLIGFDNVTLGDRNSTNIVPEPSSLTLTTLGVLSLVAGANRRRRQQKAAV